MGGLIEDALGEDQQSTRGLEFSADIARKQFEQSLEAKQEDKQFVGEALGTDLALAKDHTEKAKKPPPPAPATPSKRPMQGPPQDSPTPATATPDPNHDMHSQMIGTWGQQTYGGLLGSNTTPTIRPNPTQPPTIDPQGQSSTPDPEGQY